MNGRRTVPAAALIAALLIGLTGCGFPSFRSLPAPRAVSGDSYPLTADFQDTLNLPIGAKVKLAGAIVGEVTSITTSNYVAHIGMQINSAIRLSAGSTFQVRFTTPLGENYVAVTEPPTNGTDLVAGAHIALAQTTAAPSIEDAFASLAVLINGGGLSQIGGIVKQLNVAFSGRGDTVRSILQRTRTLVADLNRREGDLDRTLVGLNRLARQLAKGTVILEEGLRDFPPALEALADQTDRLRTLLNQVQTLSDVATGVLQRSTASFIDDVRDLSPIANALATIRGDLAPTMRKLILFGEKLESAAPGDYLNASGQLALVVDGSPPLLPPSVRGAR